MLTAQISTRVLEAAVFLDTKVPNPLSGQSPSWGPFASFGPQAHSILNLIWMFALFVSVATLLIGFAKFRRSRTGGYGVLAEDANFDLQNGFVRVAGVALAASIVGLILTFATA